MFIEEKLIKYIFLKSGIIDFSLYKKFILNNNLKKTLLNLYIKYKNKIFEIIDKNIDIITYLNKVPKNDDELINKILDDFIYALNSYKN